MERLEDRAYAHDVEVERYREEIVEMVGKIESKDYLFKIYHYILAKFRRDKGQG